MKEGVGERGSGSVITTLAPLFLVVRRRIYDNTLSRILTESVNWSNLPINQDSNESFDEENK